jgi:hypothetical protein
LAFLRFTRDKRGVENFYLVQPTANRRGKVRQRVLYWFRSPPNVKVGRQPFDPAVRRALEAQNPDVTFDWRAIVETPIPSADAEKWRERRRADRAAKHAAAEEEPGESLASETGSPEAADIGETLPTTIESAAAASDTPSSSGGSSNVIRPDQIASSGGGANRRRRRRRRGPAPPTSATEPSGE